MSVQPRGAARSKKCDLLCVVLAVALSACAGQPMLPTPTPDAPTPLPLATAEATSTTIVIPALQPTTDSTATPQAQATATNAAPVNSPLASPTVQSQPVVVLTPTSVISNQTVLMPRISPTATTGITSTDLVSLTQVPQPVVPVRLPEGTINIALLGIDTRPSVGDPTQPNRSTKNSDVIIIASIQPSVPAVTMLSIPRDTLVYLPNSRFAKVNTAYAYGGPDYFKQTIKYNFGLNIDYYAAVNFSAVVNAVSTLGGIDVVATCPLYQVFPRDPYYFADETTPLTVTVPYTDSFTGEVWQPGQLVPTQTIYIPRAGMYSLNGLQTLAFARARYGVPGGDIDRGRRTQKVARAMLTKAKSNGLAFFAQLPSLIAQFGRNVQTDLTVEQILSLSSLANQFEDTVIRSRYFDGVGLTNMSLPEVGSILVPNRDNITYYLQQAMNVPVNQQAGNSVPIEFVNGTGWDDFSVAAIDRLRELDFDVVSVKELEEVVTRTTVIDFTTTDKGSPLPRLQRAFGLKSDQITAQPQASGPRYRIVAGRDFDPCYYKIIPATQTLSGTVTVSPTVVAPAPAVTATLVVTAVVTPEG